MPSLDPARTLKALGACREARRAARLFGTPQMAYINSRRGDHLAWYFGRLAYGTGWGSPEHRRAALVSVICARRALPHVPEAPRAELAEILTQIEGWARGGSLTRENLLALRQRALEIRSTLWRAAPAAAAAYAADAYAADAAAAATYAAAAPAAAAAYAAPAAAAAYAADAYAADAAAAYAAYAAAYAADAARWSARQVARETALRDLARLIRAEFPRCPLPNGI